MKSFSIEIDRDYDTMEEFLVDRINNLKLENLDLDINEENNSKFLNINFEDKYTTELKKSIATVLTDSLFKIYFLKFSDKILKLQYKYFEKDDNNQVKQRLEDIANSGYSIERQLTYDKVYNDILKYVEENDKFNVDGFVTFRLKDYCNYIQDEIERIVDDLFMEKEYNEFVSLLKYFVDMQEPHTDEINIVAEEEMYKLYDKDFNEIDSENILELGSDLNQGSINKDDLLVSWLITAAPAKLVIHNSQNMTKQVLKTITNVFTDKLEICNGCKHCSTEDKKFTFKNLKENFKHNLDNIYK